MDLDSLFVNCIDSMLVYKAKSRHDEIDWKINPVTNKIMILKLHSSVGPHLGLEIMEYNAVKVTS